MDKELNEAIEYLKLIRKNHDLEKKGYVYTEECITTVLNRLEEYQKQLDLDYVDKNYIPKKKVEDKIEELEKEIIKVEQMNASSTKYDTIQKLDNQLNVLQELLEEK